MSNLPKYYFQDLPAEVMEEIVNEMGTAKLGPTWEQIVEWYETENTARTISNWLAEPSRLWAEQLANS